VRAADRPASESDSPHLVGGAPEDPRYGAAVERWEEIVEWPMAILAVVFLAAYAWPVLAYPLGQPWRAI